MAGGGIEGIEAPIIEDEELDAAEGAQETSIAAVAARKGEVMPDLVDLQ